MDVSEVIWWGQQTLVCVGTLGGPILLAALAVGVIVSLLQAMTQIHEMTLVFIPKMLAVFAILLLTGGWMLDTMVSFGTSAFTSAADWKK